jgi:hypothetical protein
MGMVEARPSNFTPTPALRHQGEGRKRLYCRTQQSFTIGEGAFKEVSFEILPDKKGLAR